MQKVAETILFPWPSETKKGSQSNPIQITWQATHSMFHHFLFPYSVVKLLSACQVLSRSSCYLT